MNAGDALQLNRILWPVTTLGPGVRVGLWVQGCTIGCRGCASTDTWADDGGTSVAVTDVADQVTAAALASGATGLTVTGGEPFQQADAVAALIDSVRSRWPGGEPMDALVFTGYTAPAARRISPALWRVADIMVAGPYRRDRPSGHPLIASSNQTVEVLTALGGERQETLSVGRRMQVAVEGDVVSLVGLPQPGDLDRLRIALEGRGIRLGSVSWQES